jgi:hypothetical protein
MSELTFEHILCAHCKAAFSPRSASSKYCSVKCQHLGRRKPRLSHPPPTKRCSSCGGTKSSDVFNRNNKSWDLLQSQCKPCMKERKRKANHVYYRCEYCGRRFLRIARSPNAEKTRSCRCRRCARDQKIAENGGHSLNYTGTTYFAGRLLANWRSSAKRRKKEWKLTKEQLDEKFNSQHGICALSGLEMEPHTLSPYRPSIDRIDSTKGYVEGNFQFVCSRINVMKNKIDEPEFIRLCRLVSQHKERVP